MHESGFTPPLPPLHRFCCLITSRSLPYGQIDCVDDARSVELIFLECEADFDDINFDFGGEDFALTVRLTSLQQLVNLASVLAASSLLFSSLSLSAV